MGSKKEVLKEFKNVWEKETISIRNSSKGARGNVLLQSHSKPTEVEVISKKRFLFKFKAFLNFNTGDIRS